jgi:hypothetical protein
MTGKGKKGRPSGGIPPSVRVTVSLPADVHRIVEALAKEKRVSVAWILRDAAQEYLGDRWPLLGEGR